MIHSYSTTWSIPVIYRLGYHRLRPIFFPASHAAVLSLHIALPKLSAPPLIRLDICNEMTSFMTWFSAHAQTVDWLVRAACSVLWRHQRSTSVRIADNCHERSNAIRYTTCKSPTGLCRVTSMMTMTTVTTTTTVQYTIVVINMSSSESVGALTDRDYCITVCDRRHT